MCLCYVIQMCVHTIELIGNEDWLEGDLHAALEELMQERRCHSEQQWSHKDRFPLWHSHQYRPPYPLGHTQSFTAVSTLLRPHHNCGNSRSIIAPDWPTLFANTSTRLSGEKAPPLIARSLFNGCTLSPILDHASMALLLRDEDLGSRSKAPHDWVSSLPARGLVGRELAGPEVREEEAGHHTLLLMKSLRRSGVGHSETKDSLGHGSRLLKSQCSSGNNSQKTCILSKGDHIDTSLVGSKAMSVSPSEVQYQGPMLDTGETQRHIHVCDLFSYNYMNRRWVGCLQYWIYLGAR